MHVENITSNAMSLDRNGQSMLIQVYEKEIDRLNNIIDELNEDIYHLLNVIGDNKDDIKVTSDEELAIFSCQNRLEELKENKYE